MPGRPTITLDPYAIEKTTLYATIVHYEGNRLELFEEWNKRFVNTSIVVLDMVGSGQWVVQWINLAHNNIEPAEPDEVPRGPEIQKFR